MERRLQNYKINMYPRKIELKNDKLKELLQKKGKLIEEGRAISAQLDSMDARMTDIDNELMEEEKKIDITDLNFNAEKLTARFNNLKAEMDELNAAVKERLSSQVPAHLREEYDTLNSKKKELEEERNKIAMNAQKHNDKIIPLVRKLLKDHLQNEYEDFGSVKVEDGVIKGEIFSHLEDFKERFSKANKSNLAKG